MKAKIFVLGFIFGACGGYIAGVWDMGKEAVPLVQEAQQQVRISNELCQDTLSQVAGARYEMRRAKEEIAALKKRITEEKLPCPKN